MTLDTHGRLLVLIAVIAAASAACRPGAGGAGQSAGATRLEPYVAPNKMYALHKPATWTVAEDARPNSFRILVRAPDGLSRVDFFWARHDAGRPDVLSAMAAYRRYLLQSFPGATFDNPRVAADSTRAVAGVRYLVANSAVRGRYYFESTSTGMSVQGYVAPEPSIDAQRPLLLNVMSSLAFVKVLHRGALQPPVQAAFVTRRAPDGSLTVRVPDNWGFLAAQGRIIAGAPGGGMGFVFTAFAGNPVLRGASVTQGVIGTQYVPPSQTLPLVLSGFGHRDIAVTEATADRATMAQCPAYVGRSCEAQDLVATWTSKDGAHCLGAFKVMNTLPVVMGQWSSVMMGMWGPQADFYRYYPLLEEVANSYAINDQFARAYIQAGLANLRRLQQQTAAAIQSLNDARADNQAGWEARQERKDYMDSKWDDYRRGQSNWVSDLEGGKVYKTDTWGTRDTVSGEYYDGKGFGWTNFEGQNPRYQSEGMREVSSYELEHGRPPR